MKRHFGLLIVVFLLLVLAVPTTAQEEANPSVTLTPYEDNPVVVPSQGSDWEIGGIGRPRVLAQDGELHMFYQGYTEYQASGSLCYATSEDGLHWVKYENNPIPVPDEALAPNGVMNFVVFLDSDTWIMDFTPWPQSTLWYQLSDQILMATAQSPVGTWSTSTQPVLTSESPFGWDFSGIWPLSVVRNADAYRLYFENSLSPTMIGMATSADGISWTKYDDPVTTTGRFSLSDPIFQSSPDRDAWDSGYVSGPVVRQTGVGWEMFYGAGKTQLGTRSIGYATSPDGIAWTRHGDTPLLSEPDTILSPEAIIEIDGNIYLYYVSLSNWDPTTATINVAIIDYE